MPTYDYVCDDCGHAFEKVQKMTDKPLRKCPECGRAVRRVMTGGLAGIVKSGANPGIPCGRDVPCCGADTPCSTRPCAID